MAQRYFTFWLVKQGSSLGSRKGLGYLRVRLRVTVALRGNSTASLPPSSKAEAQHPSCSCHFIFAFSTVSSVTQEATFEIFFFPKRYQHYSQQTKIKQSVPLL